MAKARNLVMWGLLTLSFLLSFCASSAYGEEAHPKATFNGKRVVLILVDRVNWQDLVSVGAHNIQGLARSGAIGLINPKTAAGYSSDNAYLTIGAGEKALAPGEAGLAFDFGEIYGGEIASDLYLGRFGQAPPQDSLFHLASVKLARINAETGYGARLGALGDALKKAGLRSAVVGNADTGEKYERQAVLIAADNQGLVPGGRIDGAMLFFDRDRPFGVSTNYDVLLQETLTQLGQASLVVVETGDARRVEAYRDMLTPDRLQEERKRALEATDRFIGNLAEKLDLASTKMIILAAAPPAVAMEGGNYLTPVIMTGGGIEPDTLLTGETTRRKGLLTLMDIAPDILRHLDLEPPTEMKGGRIGLVSSGDNLGQILALNEGLVQDYRNRLWVLLPVVGLQVLVFLLVGSSLMLTNFPIRFSPLASELAILSTTLTPLSALLLGFFNHPSPWVEVVMFIILNLILAVIIIKMITRFLSMIYLAYLLTAGFIIIDVLTGSYLMQNSPLGYDPIIGARFYGIGNEYMGFLIGAVLMGLVPLADSGSLGPKPRITLLICFGFLVFLLGSPFWGANLGGTITAVAAFGLAYMKVLGTQLSRSQKVLLVSSPLMVVFLFVSFDLLVYSGPPSHMARSAQAILEAGFPEVIRIIQRKLAMNWQLIQYMGGLGVLLPLLGLLIWGWYKSRPSLAKIEANLPAFGAAVKGTLAGSLTALVFNDSGVIAAGIMILYLFPLILSLQLADKEVILWNTESSEIRG